MCLSLNMFSVFYCELNIGLQDPKITAFIYILLSIPAFLEFGFASFDDVYSPPDKQPNKHFSTGDIIQISYCNRYHVPNSLIN